MHCTNKSCDSSIVYLQNRLLAIVDLYTRHLEKYKHGSNF